MKHAILLIIGLFAGRVCGIEKLTIPHEIFEVNGRNAFLMQPAKPAAGNPWVWYAPTLKNYPHRSQKFYFEQFLQHGIAVAGYDLGEVRGSPESTKKFTAFYEAMVERQFSKKSILLGQSRGGLMMLCWAFRNPGKVGAWVGIYPVCNLASWPLVRSKRPTLSDYGLSEAELRKRLDEFNPAGNLDGLAKAGVPMFIIHGDSDRVVPFQDNSALIKSAYEKMGGKIEVKIVPGKGHTEIPEFFTDADLIEFVLKMKDANESRD